MFFFNRRSFIEELLKDLDEEFIIVRVRRRVAKKLLAFTGSEDEEDAIERLVEMWEKLGVSEEVAREAVDYVKKIINKNVSNVTEAVRQLLADNQRLRYELEKLRKKRKKRKSETTVEVFHFTGEKVEEKPSEATETVEKKVRHGEKEGFIKVKEAKSEQVVEETKREGVEISEKFTQLVVKGETVGNELFTPTIQFVVLKPSNIDEVWEFLTNKFDVTRFGIYRLGNALLATVAATEITKGKESVVFKQFTVTKCVDKVLTIDDIEKEPELINYLRDFIQYFKEPLPTSAIKEIEAVCRC